MLASGAMSSDPQPGPDGQAPIDVVASVGALDPAVVLLREFLHRSGAVRTVAVIALEDDVALIDVRRLQPVEVVIGERTVHLPHALALDAVVLMIPDVKQLPAFDVDPATGEVSSPLGGLEHYAIAVRQLAGVLGADNVALGTWASTSDDVPLSITARSSEDALVLTLGEEEFEMEPGWPLDPRVEDA